jgi:hypothetical protein
MSLRKGMNRHYKIIYLVLLCVFLTGVLTRVLSGTSILHSELIYSSGKKESLPGVKSPEAVVKSFYIFIDTGEYERAWEISLEPVWGSDRIEVSYRDEVYGDSGAFSGWTEKDEFISRLIQNMGERGKGITLNNIEANETGKLQIDEKNQIKNRYNKIDFDEAYSVRACGQLLGACSIFKWEKDLVVLDIDGTYKVLLYGTKPKNSFFYQSWFKNISRIGDLKR